MSTPANLEVLINELILLVRDVRVVVRRNYLPKAEGKDADDD